MKMRRKKRKRLSGRRGNALRHRQGGLVNRLVLQQLWVPKATPVWKFKCCSFRWFLGEKCLADMVTEIRRMFLNSLFTQNTLVTTLRKKRQTLTNTAVMKTLHQGPLAASLSGGPEVPRKL